MWWSSAAASVAIPTVAYTYQYMRDKKNIIKRINRICSATDAVLFLQDMYSDKSTEDMTEHLTQLIISNAHNIRDDTIKRISNLSQKFKNNYDIQGYAVTLIWSCIVAATQNDILSFSD